MNFYRKYILPKVLDLVLGKRNYDPERQAATAQASGTVLEIGCGSGPNIPFYKGITKLYALDPSAELLALAKERAKQASFPVEFLEDSAEKLPFPDHSIDTVVSTWTMCSIPNPAAALREVKRVLKPGGKFLFIEHGKSNESHIAKWQTRFTPLWKHCTGGCHLDRDIEGLLKQTGFAELHLERNYNHSMPPKVLHYFYKGVAQ